MFASPSPKHGATIRTSQRGLIVRIPAVAVMLGALCSTSVQAAEPTPAQTEAWAESLLPMPEGGWERLAMIRGTVVYVSLRDAERRGPIATAPVRYEYLQGVQWMGYFPANSVVTQSEYDCVRSVHRDIASSGYSGNNLSGEKRSWVADQHSLWTPIVPDTIGEAIGRELCARTNQRSVTPAAPN